MTKKTGYKVLYLRVAPELHAALAELANAEKRSISNMAEVIIENYIREQQLKLRHRTEPLVVERVPDVGGTA